MRAQDTEVGSISLRDDEQLVAAVPTPVVRPPRLPEPDEAMAHLTRVDSVQAIGSRPAFAAAAPADGMKRGEAFGLYEALFGRDALIIARLVESRWPHFPMATFTALAELQGLPPAAAPDAVLYARRLERPGRIPHESRDPATDPIAAHLMATAGWAFPYYHSDDATPLFVRDVARHGFTRLFELNEKIVQRDGAERTLLDALGAALDHMRSSINADHLLAGERPARGSAPGLPAYGVWQDSPDAYFRTDGSLPDGPIAALEVQVCVYDALRTCAALVETQHRAKSVLGMDGRTLRKEAEAVRKAVSTQFWNEQESYFAPAVEQIGDTWHQVGGRKSAMGSVLDSEIFADSRFAPFVRAVVEALFDPRHGIVTPWGLRTLGIVDSRDRYRPDGYHNGLIWLFDNHLIALGLRRHGMYGLATWLDQQIVTACERLHLFPEHIRGDSVEDVAITEYTVDVEVTDARFGTFSNRTAQPPQLIQGWTLAAYIDAQRCLERYPREASSLRGRLMERRLLGAVAKLGREATSSSDSFGR